MEEKKLPFTGREKIRFNVPPFTGREYEYVRQAVENQKICGDGEFTKKASHWFEEKTGTAKCLMTTSCTHATELAAILADIKPGDEIEVGPFTLGFIRVNHSIADAVAIYMRTPVGIVLHTGDYKIDHTPVDGQVTGFNKFAELGDEGVLVMLSDSTNAERPGFTKSERSVGTAFDERFRAAPNRIIIASFSSNVHRLQQAIDAA